jgi:octaprenyl-diphosphate synthase
MLATEISRHAVPVPDSLPQDSSLSWKQVVASAEPFLRSVADRLAGQIQSFDPQIAGYAEYALTNQGKQLRPALLALSAGATGKINDSHVLAAVVVEMVHLATLVHDDVMDEAKIRRGRPTMAAHWGNEISVLLGDCLFAHALKLAASFPTTEICRAVAAATNTVCSGEILQTQSRKNFELTRSEYFKMLQMKTGELFALSCDLGACLSGAPAAGRACLRQFGLAIGTAYQIFDDCLDLFGSEASAGKSLGTDLATGKVTLPVLILLESVTPSERRKMLGLLQQSNAAAVRELMDALVAHETMGASRAIVHHHLRTANQCLTGLPDSESRNGLLSLTDYLGQQIDSLGQLAPVPL